MGLWDFLGKFYVFYYCYRCFSEGVRVVIGMGSWRQVKMPGLRCRRLLVRSLHLRLRFPGRVGCIRKGLT